MRPFGHALAVLIAVAPPVAAQSTILRCGTLVDGVEDIPLRDAGVRITGAVLEDVRFVMLGGTIVRRESR